MMKTLRDLQQREDGFTLIELLIVVLIIGALAAIVIPVYLGIQAGAHKSAVRGDVNIKVKTIQAALTEGAKVSDFIGTTSGTESGETIQVKASTTTGAAANDFMVVGSESTTVIPAAAITYAYTYDSVTGNFTEGTPLIASAVPTATGKVGTAYTYNVIATGTPTPTYSATGLPTGLTINATNGLISGTPTTAGTYTYTITAQNGTTPNATQTGQIVIQSGSTVYDFPSGSSLPAAFTKSGTGNATPGGGVLYLNTATSSTVSVTLTINVPTSATVAFSDRISSESGYDFGRFSINGSQQYVISGNGSTTAHNYTLSSGTHTFNWTYSKDGSVDAFNDTYYVYPITITNQ